MSILLLTAAQSGLITSLDGNLDNVFTFGAQNSGTGGTVLTALSGYSIDRSVGGGIDAQAVTNRAIIRQSYEAIAAGLISALNIPRAFPIDEIVNVKDYGAKGDNSNDDTSAFASALAATTAIVYVPPGQYILSGSGISIPQFKSLIGAGPQKTILKYTGTGACITLDGVQGCRVENFQIVVLGANASSSGILMNNTSAKCQWNRIVNNVIQADVANPRIAGQNGLFFNCTTIQSMYWNHVENNRFQFWDTGILMQGNISPVNGANQNFLANNMFASCTTGLWISTNCVDNQVHGLYGSASGNLNAQTLLIIGDGSTNSTGNLCFGVTSDQGANGKVYTINAGSTNNVIWSDNESSVAGTDANAAATNTNIRVDQKPLSAPTINFGNVSLGQQVIAASPTPNTTPMIVRGAVANSNSSIAVRLSNNAAFTTATLAKIVQITNGNTEVIAWDLNGKEIRPVGAANAVVGIATLVTGTVTVSTTAVTANSIIILTRQTNGGTAAGVPTVGTITAGTSFVINSITAGGTAVQAGDTSVIGWMIIN